jgi:hypothetical protein
MGEPDPGALDLDHTLDGSRPEGGPGHRAIRPFEHRVGLKYTIRIE